MTPLMVVSGVRISWAASIMNWRLKVSWRLISSRDFAKESVMIWKSWAKSPNSSRLLLLIFS